MSQTFNTYATLNLPEIDREILTYWEEQGIFKKSIESRSKERSFVFFEGPPSANGMPGIHHVMARTVKDLFCRFKTLQGFRVDRKAGWDTHGLPVELGVEKSLGITKEDIGKKISIEDYNKACKEAVLKYTDVWNDLTQKMGYWVDMENPYITFKSKYMESVWWILAQIYQKNLLYKGYTIQPYSPKAGTGLSSHELNQPGCYRDVSDTSVVAQFKMAKHQQLPNGNDDDNIYFLAWTTTPWTLPSNTALTVGKNIDYVLIKTYNQYTHKPIQIVLAKALISKQFAGKYTEVEAENDINSYSETDKKIPFFVADSFKGSTLEGIRYEQLMPLALPFENPEHAFRIILGDFVTTEDGTGIVHTAPTFGADDAKVAAEANPPVPPMLVLDHNQQAVPLVDLQGKFRENLGYLSGKYVKNEYYDDAEMPEKSIDVEICIDLKEQNKAFKVEKYKHNYPHCWRTDKPILYYPLDSWFIKITEVRERLSKLNQSINWKPESTGKGRFGNWLATANDWNLSRSRFWGIPLPIWRTEDGSETKIIASIAQLKNEVEKSVAAGFMAENPLVNFVENDMSEANYERVDLHKNVVDQLILVSESGKKMQRESDLIDVWFDSGSMPYAQWHYPFENKDEVESTLRKADFIAEGVDQTRGWFYTLHAIAGILFEDVAYKNVVSNGLVLDKNGHKMSKRLGNAVDPFAVIKNYGADAVRWYMISNANPWDNLKFDQENIVEVLRKFFGTLYNTYGFFALYANIDSFDYTEDEVPLEQRTELDRWILSELNSLILRVTEAYEQYEPTKAARAISDFVQDYLSNWYVRLCRRRFWKGEYNTDKVAAYQTLYQCLKQLAIMIAPIAPFYSERLYLDLTQNTQVQSVESVHLEEFPKANKACIQKELEEKMQRAQAISSLALSLRKKEKIKVRQPLNTLMVSALNDNDKEILAAIEQLILAEVNVKELRIIDQNSGLLVKEAKPNFKLLGPKYGKQLKAIQQAISNLSQEKINRLESGENINLELHDESVVISPEEVEIAAKDIEGWLVASERNNTVALDINITESLYYEGVARELVNRIQNLRKEIDLEVTDRIEIFVENNDIVQLSVKDNAEYIKGETLANSINFADHLEDGIEITFDNVDTKIDIKKT